MEPSNTVASQQFTLNGIPKNLQDKVGRLIKILNNPVIDMKELRAACSKGIPDEASHIRSTCWKLLYGYLPQQRNKWDTVIKSNQKTYRDLVAAFLPQKNFEGYPLVLDKGSARWEELQHDFLLWQQIEKDTSRTHADLAFFSMPCQPIMIPFLTGARKQKHRMVNGDEIEKYHEFMGDKELQRITYRYHVMTRILFVYSKLNPKIGYVQGMNEILAPIFYLVNSYKTDSLEEASCFFMMNNAISSVLDMHMKDLDSSDTGISGKTAFVNKMLYVIDKTTWHRLNNLKIQPFFYCFRWLSLLYAQQFQLFDVLRLWDSMFSRTNRVKYANFIAISILITHKQSIMDGQFIQVLQRLQNLKFDTDIEQIIIIADELESKWSSKNIQEIYQKERGHEIRKESKKKEKKEDKGILGNLRDFLN